MFNWIKKLFNKLDNMNSRYYTSPINRVKSLSDKNLSGKPKEWSIYGSIIKNKTHYAIIHWQGWEDAGWKLIPIKNLEPFRLPKLRNVEFYYTYPIEISKFNSTDPKNTPICKIIKYVLTSKGGVRAVVDIGGSNITTPLKYLYDVEDPQFYD